MSFEDMIFARYPICRVKLLQSVQAATINELLVAISATICDLAVARTEWNIPILPQPTVLLYPPV